jgi:hypothetical protein
VKIATEQDREQVLVLTKELNQLLEPQQRQKSPQTILMQLAPSILYESG